MTTLTDTQTRLNSFKPTIQIRQVTDWRTTIARWAPALTTAVLLGLAVAHLLAVWNVQNPDAQWGFLLQNEAQSAWKPWSRAAYRQLLLVGTVLLGVGLLGQTAGRRLVWPRLARSIVLAGVLAIVGAQLRLRGFYDLGLGFDFWTWGLPVRLAGLTIAFCAMLSILRPAQRWPKIVLLVGVLGVVLLWSIPRRATPTFHPSTQFCAFSPPGSRLHPACRIDDQAASRAPLIPLLRAATTASDRAKVADFIGRDLDCLEDGRCALVRQSSQLRRLHVDHHRVSLWHYQWQKTRLIGFGLLLVFGLPLSLLVLLRRSTSWRIPLAGCAAVALICATGLSPAWSYLSPWRHVLGALLLPLAVPLAALTVAHLHEPCAPA